MNTRQLLITLQPPVSAPITQEFGEHPEVYVRWGLPGHNGRDYGAPENTPAAASADGIVDKVGYENGGFGLYVKLKHPGLIYTYYAHLNKALVEPGQRLSAGDTIGLSGSTGYTTGPHLHFGVKGPGGDPAYQGWLDPALLMAVPSGPATAPAAADELHPITLAAPFTVQTPVVNVRAGPGLGYPVVGRLVAGQIVQVGRLYVETGWLEIGDGRFCAAAFGGETYLVQVQEDRHE